MNDQPSSPKTALNAGWWKQHGRVTAVCLALAAVTFAVFGQTALFRFVNYDDNKYVYGNPPVGKGVTIQGLLWALTDDKTDHWHPLTWLSHMLDCQLYGLDAGGHHLTSVALQAAAAALLFLALREMTGSLWRSAFVAAVFAIHPLRAESVAWIAERKDVLSGVFFMLALWTYARYARQPSGGRYAAVVAAYALGLMSKNTLVTLPFVLLLLDWWPLRRWDLNGAGGGKGMRSFRGLVKEKIPLFLLSLASCVVTLRAPQGVIVSDRIPLLERLGNAVVSYAVYLWQMVFPAGLTIPCLYPPRGWPSWEIGLALVVLAAISVAVWACRRKRPYLLVGWLWYLGMLVPAIGIVQISYQAYADRFTYLPGVGVALAATWLVADWRLSRVALGSIMAGVIGLLMVCAWQQTSYWQDSETLWTRSLACNKNNSIAAENLGVALVQDGKDDAAITCFLRALDLRPDFAEARNSLGNAYLHTGRTDDAIACFQQALQTKPNYADAHNDLGTAFCRNGKVDDGIAEIQQALSLAPDNVTFHCNLGNALLQKGEVDDAIAQYQAALRIDPDDSQSHFNLGIALAQARRLDEAILHYQKALQIRPAYAEAENNLGNILTQARRLDEAIWHFKKALQINPAYGEAEYNLGGALLYKGNASEARDHFERALQLAPSEPTIQNSLAWLLAVSPDTSQRDGKKAVELASQADALTGGSNPLILRTLAAAFAQAGRYAEAVETAKRALQLAEAPSNATLAGELRYELQLYQTNSPYHSRQQSK
jgi:tetratricopeptide (TPR) repeat protein